MSDVISMPVEELQAHCRSMEDVCISYETVLARLREERVEGLPPDIAAVVEAELARAVSRVRALADGERAAAGQLRLRVEQAIRAAEAPADPLAGAAGAPGASAGAGAAAPAAAPASQFADLPEAGGSERAADPADPEAYDPTADAGGDPGVVAGGDPVVAGGDPAVTGGDPAAAAADPAAAASGSEFPAEGTPADMLAYASKRAIELGLVITSTTGGVHAPGSYHYQGRAIDVAGPPPAMAAFYTEFAMTLPTELFYDPLGAIKNGAPIPPIGGHVDHVHIAY